MTKTATESLNLEMLAKAQDKFAMMLSESFHGSDIVPIRAIKRPTLRYLRRELRTKAKANKGDSTYLSRTELRAILEESAELQGFARYTVGLKVNSKGVPKYPYQPTFIAEPQRDGGQEYWVRKSYAETFNAGKR